MKTFLLIGLVVLVLGITSVFIAKDICGNKRQQYFQSGINYTGKQIYDTIKTGGSVDLTVDNDTITLIELKNDQKSN